MPATDETYAATSAICFVLSWPLNDGITPLPFVTRSTTRSAGGFASSRFGPTVPVAPASFSVWQLSQPAVAKTCLPAAASPFACGGCATLPIDGLRRRRRGRSRRRSRPARRSRRAESGLGGARARVYSLPQERAARPASAASALRGLGANFSATRPGPCDRQSDHPVAIPGRAARRGLPVARPAHREPVACPARRAATTIRDSRQRHHARARRPGQDRRRVRHLVDDQVRACEHRPERRRGRCGGAPPRRGRCSRSRASVSTTYRTPEPAQPAEVRPSTRGRRRAPRSAGSRPAGTSRAPAGCRRAAR